MMPDVVATTLGQDPNTWSREQIMMLGAASVGRKMPSNTSAQYTAALKARNQQPVTSYLWDSEPIANGNTGTVINLFQNQKATLFRSNVNPQGRLSGHDRFFVKTLEAWVVYQGGGLMLAADATKCLRYCSAVFTVGSAAKQFHEMVDLTSNPPTGGVNMVTESDASSVAATQYEIPRTLQPVPLEKTLYIEPDVSFKFKLEYEIAPNPSAAVWLFVRLGGERWRDL